VSLKARSAIGLAGHGGTAVTWAQAELEHFATSRAFSSGAVPEVARFLARDPFQDDATREWTLRDPASSYRYADASLGSRPQELRTGLFPHRIGGPMGTDAPFFTLWQVSPYSDAYLARMALALVDAFQLGERDTTDFLGVGFSALDLVGHSFGPESREVEDLLRRLDDTLGSFFDGLDAKVGAGNWVLALSSDHGVAPVAVQAGGGRIITQDVRERIEETLLMRYGPRAEDTYVDAVAFNNVYFAPGVYDRLRSDPATYRNVEQAALSVPGMKRILRAEELSDRSTDEEIRSAALSYQPERSGDLVLVGEPRWYFSPRTDGSATTHGTGYPYDRRVPVILLGAGIETGRFAAAATPADIAPTLAHLAGVRLGRAEGRVLRDAIR
jgi:predicted AlkP superfamily pyrophosphatase or phosphodiesterase